MADMGFLPEVRRLLDQTCPDRQTLLFSATLDGDVDVLVDALPAQPGPPRGGRRRRRAADATHLFWQHRPRPSGSSAAPRSSTPPARRSCSAAPVTAPTGWPSSSAARRRTPPRSTAAVPRASATVRSRTSRRPGRRRSSPPTSPPAASTSTTSPASCTSTSPADPKDYVHRSGRTARAGADGIVVSLVAPPSDKDAKKLQKAVGLDQASSTPTSAAAPSTRKVRRAATQRPRRAPEKPGPTRRAAPRDRRESRAAKRSSRPRGCAVRQAEQQRGRRRGSAKRARAASASERPSATTSTARPSVKDQHGMLRFYDQRKGYGFVVRPGAPRPVLPLVRARRASTRPS